MEKIQFMINQVPILLGALPETLTMLVTSVLIAFILGMVLACGKLSKKRIIRIISNIYISFMRGTPMIVQLLIAFIIIPLLLKNSGISTNNWDNVIYAIIAFSLNEAAFFAEIFRGAYLDIDKGQIEAGESIGMTRFQIFRRIIFPQAAAVALPNTMNMIIELMKNTSIGMAIGVVDMMGMAKQISYNAYGVGQTEIFVITGVLYWIMGMILSGISSCVTERLNRCNSPVMVEKKLKISSLFKREGAI